MSKRQVGVQVILEVSAIGNAVHVGFGKQLVVQVDLSVHAVLAADPMDGACLLYTSIIKVQYEETEEEHDGEE